MSGAMSMKWCSAIAFFLLLLPLLAQSPGTIKPSVIMAPVPDVQLRPGAAAKVELDFRVGASFHINSNKPKSPLLIPTSLKLVAPNGVQVALQYPAGEDQSFPFSPNEKLSVYTGDFAIDASLKALPNVHPGTYPITGELHFQACDRNACYPPKTQAVQFNVVVK
jgi:hypothetical protein